MTVSFHSLASRICLLILLGPFSLLAQGQPQAELQQKLRERVEQLYRFYGAADWKQMESLITEDSKELWAASPKNPIESFQVGEVKLAPDGLSATVAVLITFRHPRAGGPFTAPETSDWVYQNGDWYLKLRPRVSFLEVFNRSSAQTDPAQASPPLRFEQNPVRIAPNAASSEIVVRVPFQNAAPTAVTIQELGTTCSCLKAELDKTSLPPGEKGVLTLSYSPSLNPEPQRPPAVHAVLAPSMAPVNLPLAFEGK